MSEPLIPSEVKDTNQAVSEANEQDQVVLCMSDYGRDKLLWKSYGKKSHQKSHGRLPRHLHTPGENKEALQAVSKTNKCAYVKDQADKANNLDDQEIEFQRYTSIITVTKSIGNRENMS